MGLELGEKSGQGESEVRVKGVAARVWRLLLSHPDREKGEWELREADSGGVHQDASGRWCTQRAPL